MSIREDLKAYLDGELAPERAEEVRGAIEADPAMQLEVQFMKLLGASIREASPLPPVQGGEKVLQAVRQRPAPLPRIWVWSAGFALTLVALIGIGSLSGRFSKPKSNEAEGTMSVAVAGGGAVRSGPVSASPVPSPTGGNSPGMPAGRAEPKTMSIGRVDMSAGTNASEGPPSHAAPPTKSAPAFPDGTAGDEIGQHSTYPRDRAPATAPKSILSQNGASASRAVKAGGLLGARRVIQNADLTLAVEDARAKEAEAEGFVKGVGGYVSSSSLDYDSDHRATATITLRIPVDRFSETMNRLRNLGDVKADHISGEDVTTQIADSAARLAVLKAERDDYMAMLRNTHQIDTIIELKDHISELNQEIDSEQSQESTLKDLSALSTINVTLIDKGSKKAELPAPVRANWASQTWASSINGLHTTLQALGAGLIVAFVYAPIWAPIGLIGWWLMRRSRMF